MWFYYSVQEPAFAAHITYFLKFQQKIPVSKCVDLLLETLKEISFFSFFLVPGKKKSTNPSSAPIFAYIDWCRQPQLGLFWFLRSCQYLSKFYRGIYHVYRAMTEYWGSMSFTQATGKILNTLAANWLAHSTCFLIVMIFYCLIWVNWLEQFIYI